MAFAWKASGLTYNKYLSVAARVVRRSLKDDKRLAAERRGEMELRFAKWTVSVAAESLVPRCGRVSVFIVNLMLKNTRETDGMVEKHG
ncbi:hypothetical protein M7I_5373 [Glarea lozoyensis 74030]|uniref:ATP synthase subunit epsilon, mitochondrial n=1 Tax=Glarea lozoyensis (strain ATCC 74030 / MF5533) TaxID=1104152 RepID=H0ERQ2_GLAL7|nr:hypothetical protein M7I_5373 [Glarea lozoyensis 74030]